MVVDSEMLTMKDKLPHLALASHFAPITLLPLIVWACMTILRDWHLKD